jgi:hypothetical protein
VYDPQYDDTPDPFDQDYSTDREMLDSVYYAYDDEFDDDPYDEQDYEFPQSGENYRYREASHRGWDPQFAYESIIWPDDRQPQETSHFWTRRRIIIALLVMVMIAALLAPTVYQIIIAAHRNAVPFYPGPTSTALPSI